MISDQAIILGLSVVAAVSLLGNLAQAFYAAHLEDLIAPFDRDGDGRPGGHRPALTVEASGADVDRVASAVKADAKTARRRAL